MPLSESSTNIRRSASHARDKAASDGGSVATPSLPPRAVQSMLKTTTELGDLGQFAIRPPRLPRSGSRHLSARPRSGSFDTAFARRHERSSQVRRHGRPHGTRPIASSSGIVGRNISQSNLSSYTNASRRRRCPPGPHPYPFQGPASPGPGPRRLYHHRSLLTMSSHSSIPSRSPVLVPSRIRTPGYQASSSSYSDARSISRTPRPGYLRAPSMGTIGSSPASIRPRHHGVPGYRPDVSGSYTSLVRLPSPAVSLNRNAPYPALAPFRSPTPASMMIQQQHGMTPNHSLGGLSRSPTSSTVPQYYDYSESFTEEDCFSPEGVREAAQPPLNLDQTVLGTVPTPPPRNAQTPFGTMAGSTFHPIELSTQHNRRPSEQSQPSFNGVIPKRISSLGAPALHKNSPEVCQARRTRSVDSGPSDAGRPDRIVRRPSMVSRRSCTPSKSSIFFQSAARSSRDLMTMAARVHSPPAGGRSKPTQLTRAALQHNETAQSPQHSSVKETGTSAGTTLPTFVFSPISFEYFRPNPAARPRTSEATPIRKFPEILSPMPERPMSSQSWIRFSNILKIEDNDDHAGGERHQPSFSCSKPSMLNKIDEAPIHMPSRGLDGALSTDDSGSPASCPAQNDSGPNQRTSQVASHDESSFGSLLDRHIECLGLQSEAETLSDSAIPTNEIGSPVSCPAQNGSAFDQKTSQVASHESSSIGSITDTHFECLGLQPEAEHMSVDATSSACCQKDQLSSPEDTVNLTDLLAAAPVWEKGRPTTSSSCRHPSLAPVERQRLKPRRLFASMDAGIPKTITECSTLAFSTLLANKSRTSRPSYGWQTLPSMSQLVSRPFTALPSLTSGELADVDSPEQEKKFKVRRRSNLSMSASEPSHLSKSGSSMLTLKQSDTLHQRSKSTVVASQESHRRRILRIRLQLKTKSSTVGDIAVDGFVEPEPKTGVKPVLSEEASTRQSSTKLPVNSYTESSWETVTPSKTASPQAQTPVLPIGGSNIMPAMPEPVKRAAELSPEASVQTVRSRRRKISITEPVNTSRISAQLPPLGSVPRLATPQFGPPLSSSDLNLSLPYASVPSTTRPTLRETKSFFLEDSSAQQQRTSIRQKLRLHSLRRVLPGSAGHTPFAHSFNGATVKLSHSCQIKGRKSEEDESALPPDIRGMSDFAYKKRKVLERLRGWWRRQCMSRIHRRRGDRTAPGGVGW